MQFLRRVAARGLGIPVAAAMAIGIGLAAPSSATADTNPTDLSAVSGPEAESFVTTVMAEVESGMIDIHAPESTIDSSEAVVLNVPSTDGSALTSVTLPVGGEFSLVSNFTALVNEAGDVIQYTETLLSENAGGNFQLVQYLDGVLDRDQDTGIAYATDDELIETSPDASAPGEGVTTMAKNTAQCIAATLGVSMVVAGLIMTVCGGSCAAAATGVGAAICAACIGAYAVVGGSSITAIASCF